MFRSSVNLSRRGCVLAGLCLPNYLLRREGVGVLEEAGLVAGHELRSKVVDGCLLAEDYLGIYYV